ncbi:hypothetical protein BH11PLA2_BH11PLA2_25620 [soil metagenome]
MTVRIAILCAVFAPVVASAQTPAAPVVPHSESAAPMGAEATLGAPASGDASGGGGGSLANKFTDPTALLTSY